jgi:hypothetical protein
MGLPEALPGGGAGAGQDRSAALDALFGRPLPVLAGDLGDGAWAAVGAGLGPLRDMASAAWAGLEPPGISFLRAPALRWRRGVDALFQAGVAEARVLGDAACRLLSGEDVAPAPGPGEEEGVRLPVEDARPPEAVPGPEAAAANPSALAAYWAVALVAAAAGTAAWADGDVTGRTERSRRGRPVEGALPADRVLDGRGVIPPKGGHNHGR